MAANVSVAIDVAMMPVAMMVHPVAAMAVLVVHRTGPMKVLEGPGSVGQLIFA
jgi:hypothetical protein